LKENVIVGRLVPAGTGSVMNRFKRIAAARDKELEVMEAKDKIEMIGSTEEQISAAE